MSDFDKFIDFLDKGTVPTKVELAGLELIFRDFDTKEREIALRWLDSYFSVAEDAAFRVFWPSYFRWYVELSWTSLNGRDINFVERTFKRQVPMAILLDFDVYRKLMWYLALKSKDKEDTVAIYSRIKNAFLSSEAMVGLVRGEEMKVKDLVGDIKIMDSREKSTIAEAEYVSSLKQAMFIKDDEFYAAYVLVKPDEAVNRICDLTRFFLRVEAKDIGNVVDSFVTEAEGLVIRPLESSTPAVAPKPVAQPPKPIVPPTPVQIKNAIEDKFKKDKDGQFEKLEEVLDKLGQLAEKYKNPKIAEMYYYDEAKNKFVWNI